jgi:hypothetical protein
MAIVNLAPLKRFACICVHAGTLVCLYTPQIPFALLTRSMPCRYEQQGKDLVRVGE